MSTAAGDLLGCLPLSPQLLGRCKAWFDLLLLSVVALCPFILRPPRCWGPAAQGYGPRSVYGFINHILYAINNV